MNPVKELLYRLRGEYTTEKLVSMGMKVGKNFGRLNVLFWILPIAGSLKLAIM